jgi:hypothetical protein
MFLLLDVEKASVNQASLHLSQSVSGVIDNPKQQCSQSTAGKKQTLQAQNKLDLLSSHARLLFGLVLL